MSDKEIKNKTWGGRFTESTDAFVGEFTASVSFDQRMYAHDIAGSQAHARMLAKIDILSEQECASILTASLSGSARHAGVFWHALSAVCRFVSHPPMHHRSPRIRPRC